MIVIEPPSSGTGIADAFSSLSKPELARFLTRARKVAAIKGEITVLLGDDQRLRGLNRQFRGKNKATDVLSFPAAPNGEGVAGDLAISVETAARQAAEHGHTLDEELRILLLHGVLHLAGFDHEADTGEMLDRETELRARLKLPVGLIERTLPAGVSKAPATRTKALPKRSARQVKSRRSAQ